MGTKEFIAGLQSQLELENELELSTNLKELEMWDSIADMIPISYVDRAFGIKIGSKDSKGITTVESLLTFLGKK